MPQQCFAQSVAELPPRDQSLHEVMTFTRLAPADGHLTAASEQ
jgi:hypothetical protein